MEILRNAIEYIESLEEMLHGQGKLNKNLTPGALAAAAAAAAAVGGGAGGSAAGGASSTVNTSATAEFLVSPSYSLRDRRRL